MIRKPYLRLDVIICKVLEAFLSPVYCVQGHVL